MKRFILNCTLLFCVANFFVGVKCEQWLLENSRDDLELNRFMACAAECLENESEMVASKMSILETVSYFCHGKKFAPLKPVIESKSSETVQLLCRDVDTVVISVQTNSKSRANDAGSTGEFYVVKIDESDGQFPSRMVYMVSEVKKREKKWLKKLDLMDFGILQSDSAHVKLEGLSPNESFNVTVGIVNAMREYRVLPEIVVRTLPSVTYRPQAIPSESITVGDFATDEDPNSLSAYVHWTPADGMCFCHSFSLAFSSNKIGYFLRHGLPLWDDCV